MATAAQRVCPTCEAAINAERLETYCSGCGAIGYTFEPPAERCPVCRSRPKPFAAIAIVGSHKGALRETIVQWKFGYCPGSDRMLGDWLAEAISRQCWAGHIDGLVPIPQPWTRWLVRQRFAVGDLAACTGACLGIPVWPVLRARRHRPQVGLGGQARLRNVREVFQVHGKVDVKGWRLCLIDDVTTTGATLEAAAEALGRAGAAEVYAAAISKPHG